MKDKNMELYCCSFNFIEDLEESDPKYIATEWEVAYLRGSTVKERALALIHIAHPDHREWLFKEAKKIGIFPENYSMPLEKPDNVIVKRD